jgi:hypothetical protein
MPKRSPTCSATPARTRRYSSPASCTTSSRTPIAPWPTLSERFGETVAEIVAQLTEDDSIQAYAPRKFALRDQVRAAGSPAMNIALADKIATVRHALVTGTPVRERKRLHYRATLEIARHARVDDTLCGQLEQLLDQVEAHSAAYA